MTEHANIRLKDGRDLEFPLYPGWRDEVTDEMNEMERVIEIGRTWFTDIEDSQFEDDDIKGVRVAR